MSESEIIQLVRNHFEGLFPKTCPNCHRQFGSLRDYIAHTQCLAGISSYDADVGDWAPSRPIGAVAMANCRCGTTLGLSTDGIPLSDAHLLLGWLKAETTRRQVTPTELIGYLRERVREQALPN